MNRVSFLMILCVAVFLLFTACEKIPKDVKPIDWENYNDVYTVYWNCYSSCKKIKSEYKGERIKISGWKIQSRDGFALGDDAKCAENLFVSSPFEVVYIDLCFSDAYAFLDTCDLTKKCFITGILRLVEDESRSHCFVRPVVEVTHISYIYFE